MARKTIFVSDLTGKTIDEKDAAIVTIRYADARRGQVVLDVNAGEVADLAAKGTKQARRGAKEADLCDTCATGMPGRATARRGRKPKVAA